MIHGNEVTTLARYIYSQLLSTPYWSTVLAPNGSNFFRESIPVGVRLENVSAIFEQIHSEDTRGAFGYKLFSEGVYEIRAVCEGSDYSKLELAANAIDSVFDWQNIFDTNAGRCKSQDIYVDPVTTDTMTVMCMLRNGPAIYPSNIDGVNYCHLGGTYYIQYRVE